MKTVIVSFIFMLCGLSSLHAQVARPDKCDVFYPDVLLSSVVLQESHTAALMKSSDFGQKKIPANKTFWVVYSDRDNNITYDAPGSGKKYSALSLNDRLRIAQIKNGYALVYTEPQVDIAFPMISQKAEVKGWIPMKNLLLWHSCPATEAGIYNKALFCVNLDSFGAGKDLGHLFRNPDDKSNYIELTADMKFYFIMKREGNLVLLSEFHTMDGRTDQVLIGWVANESFVAWNQRSCIEPTWEKRDVEYFADESQMIKIYSNPQLDTVIAPISFQRVETESRDPHLYRMDPDKLRFPILDNSTPQLYNCSSFAGGGKVVIGGDEKKGSALGYKEEVLREMENINIGIVIDGTASMESFYPAVKEAIKEGVKFFDSKKYKIKVGVVIYRDYSDPVPYEIFHLTSPSNPKLDMFLDSGGKGGIKSVKSDKTLEEAMFQGIDVALNDLGFKPEHSNLMLVVGDCGNDRLDKKYTTESIIEKLVEKNVHMMSFQVRRGEEIAFSLFNEQLQDILYFSLQKKYSNLKWNGKLKFKRTEDGYSLVNDVNSNLYIGSHNMPVEGQSQMKMDRLSNLMQNAIMYCSQSVENQIALISGSKYISTFIGESYDTGIRINKEYVKMKLGDAYDDEVMNSNMAFKGYTPKAHKSGRSYFKPVVFISSDELNSLIDRLASVNDAAVIQSNDREPYVNAMKALAQSMVGDITDAEMSRMGVQEIMNMVSGLNEAAGALKGYTIAEIASTQAVPEVNYLSLVNDFKRKFRALQRIKGTPYKYTRTINGLKYYWLPVEDLP